MAVISITDAAKIEFYKNGKAGASVVVGYEGERRRCARYEFTVPVPGASSITAQINGPYFVEDGGREQDIRFYIGTDPDSHANAGPDSQYTGVATVDSNKRTVTLAADIILVPDKTYYLWFFPSVDYWGWYYWSRNCTITTYGGSSSQPTVSASSVEFGKQVTIYTNRATSFTHKLEVKFGSSKTTIAQNVTDTYKWTPSEELARQIPNDTEGTATIICTTYNGSEQVGDPMETTVLLKVPSTMVPTATATWTDTSGAYDIVGTLAQKVSKLAVQVTGTGIYGSTIKSASVELDGKAYTGAALSSTGDRKLTVKVKDSRGKTGSRDYTITVSKYAVPTLTLSAHRCQQDGTADDFGEYCEIVASGKVTSIGSGNAGTLTVKYGSTTETKSGTDYQKIIAAASTQTMQISATLTDKLTNTTKSMVLSVGYATMDFLQGGKGIAFGATATEEGFVCAMPAKFTGGITGAAPDGFGFGDKMTYVDMTADAYSGMTFTEAVDTVLATMPGYSCAQVQFYDPDNGYHGNKFVGKLWKYTANYVTLEAINYSGYKAIMRKTGGTWQPWEWENPPMTYGTEYRTTERHDGKIVYAKAISLGALPNATNKSVAHGVDSSAVFVSFLGFAKSASGGTFQQFPFINNSGAMVAKMHLAAAGIVITSYSDISGYTGHAILRYTKS